MHSAARLIVASGVLSAGVGAAAWFRKPHDPSLDVPLLHEPSAVIFRSIGEPVMATGPVHLTPPKPPTPRLTGVIHPEEEPRDTRPLGVARDAPPNLPPMFFTDDRSLEGPPLDGLD